MDLNPTGEAVLIAREKSGLAALRGELRPARLSRRLGPEVTRHLGERPSRRS
jgi:hypothetical protein